MSEPLGLPQPNSTSCLVALMSTVVELTADIDELSTPLLFSNPQTPKPVDRGTLAKHVACYRSMLYFPLEYFTRTSKPILSSRATALDYMITAAAVNAASCLTESEAVEWRLVVRTVIDRIMAPEALVSYFINYSPLMSLIHSSVAGENPRLLGTLRQYNGPSVREPVPAP